MIYDTVASPYPEIVSPSLSTEHHIIEPKEIIDHVPQFLLKSREHTKNVPPACSRKKRQEKIKQIASLIEHFATKECVTIAQSYTNPEMTKCYYEIW
ncbi:hypothetical protein JTE90_015185 [Oedothorax gibbosus]|uniref:Uncharacterized protein n=1 Tax=Oedothorax gibbosus TaxID=931172 RepID=A0AAV6V784_9ARAC|nr:hypothetical protein JTE90_015185 [Oedothorax gibbosus]